MSLSACGSAEDNPRRVVDRFMHALAARDVKGAAAQTGGPDVASTAIAEMWAGLDAENSTIRRAKCASRSTTPWPTSPTWHLPGKREWRYTAQVAASRGDSGWSVRWMPTNLHPELGADQRLKFRTHWRPRAPR